MAFDTPEAAAQFLIDGISQGIAQQLQPLIDQQGSQGGPGIQALMDQNLEMHKGRMSASSQSSSNAKDYNNQSAGLLKSIVQNISLPLPGGARLFGLSSFMDKIGKTGTEFEAGQSAIKAYTNIATKKGMKAQSKLWRSMSAIEKLNNAGEEPMKKAADLKKKADKAMTPRMAAVKIFTEGLVAAATMVILVTEGLRALGKSLGGVSAGMAGVQLLGSIKASLVSMVSGKGWLNPQQVLKMQGAIGQEFGQLITSDVAGEMSRVATDFGVTTNQMVKLERTFQATAMDSRTALTAFADVGILGQTAATELAANAGAVARAGDNFNEFIRDGIANAKKLGLEFSKMESTLTGFTMDFEGTVSAFSELRAVIPGMATDFGQLLTTAMTGTTDEYVAQIRSSLLGAGISSASQMNRQQAALLEKATGFSADQIDRILAGEALTGEIEQDLTKKTNWLLIALLAASGAMLGVTIAGFATLLASPALLMGPVGVALFTTAAALAGAKGAAIGAAAGVGLGLGVSALANRNKVDDAYITKKGKTIPFSEEDNILLSKRGLTAPVAAPVAPPQDNRDMISALGRIESVLSGRQTIDLRGDQAFVERRYKKMERDNTYAGLGTGTA